jgi:hypothetical protein
MITISLPTEIEAALSEEAERLGVTAETLAADLLEERLGPNKQDTSPVDAGSKDVKEEPKTLADFLKGYVGNVDSSKETGKKSNLSEHTGKVFTEIVVQKHREGRL